MYLDKVEIHGFKSFGDAVKLNIPKGITGVIGPNGSGKSNVSDAIRWVLGEQSAKSLRGSKMEDIIFAGTEKRKPLGYAEVALTIKNPDAQVAIDYTEIVVKRRVYRSGESEYFINGSPCRMKDVQELFMDTGVGKDGYSIIGQGQIDRVLSSKPDERRTLFEEAAGIYKYKMRKVEAERKLEKQRENLTRLQDILGEIEGRLEPLSHEAEKTTRFLKLKDHLKEVDINIFIHEMDRLDQEIKALSENSASIDNQLQNKNTENSELVQKYDQLKKEREKLYQQSEEMIQMISGLEKEKEKKKSQITINKEKIISTRRLLEQISLDQKDQLASHQSRKEKLSFLETKRIALELEKASQETIIAQDEAALSELTENTGKISESIDAHKDALRQKLREIDLYEADIKKNDGIESQLEFRREQLKQQIDVLNSDIQHQEVSIRLLEKNKGKCQTELESLKNNLGQLETDRRKFSAEKQEEEKKLMQLRQSVTETERQLKWLTHIKEENEGFYDSVKKVLNVVKAAPSQWQGIVGVVGELMQVPEKYEIAIVTALGGAIQNIVTQTEKDAKNMIRVMKQRGISRVTFLPLDTVRPGYPVNEQNLLKEEGFLGFASELIGYDKKYEVIISSLLGRILVVSDMEHGSRIAKTYHYKYKIVTLEGEVFNSGGSLSGGSMKNQANNIFTRTRELKEATERLKSLKEEFKQREESALQAEQQLKTLLVQIEETQKQWSGKNEQDRNFALELEKNQHALKLTKANQLQLIGERNNIDDSMDEINKGKEKAHETLEALRAGLSEKEKEISELEGNLSQSRVKREEMEKALTEKRISLSGTIQNMNYMLEQIKELEQAINGYDEKSAQIQETIKKYELEIQTLNEETEKIKEYIAEDEGRIKASYEKRKSFDEMKKTYEKEESKMTEKTAKVKEQIDLLKDEKYRLESKKENSVMQKQNWGNTMWQQYEMTFTAAMAFKKENINLSDYKKQSVELRSQIKQIGSVNVNAVEEYEETRKRYEFLTGQREDIEKAALSLEEMITQLLEQMKEIFRAQFAIIAHNFTEVFKELFGGGEAYLELMDEDNILESGIEIIAKPPGKKLQNMTLLSGGERTLTAISLIFGILKLKPSPFCVLDEIEAALDDANVIRFADYLERLSDETQFIVITHRKGTMERANTLYGVTMQERGVSTVLSIQLDDVDKYMDKKKTS